MMRDLKRKTAFVLSLAMVLQGWTFSPAQSDVYAATETPTTSESTVLDASKTATWSDVENGIGEVNLSLPGKEAKNKVNIVFAIDFSQGTESSNFAGAAVAMLQKLLDKHNLEIKAGVVVGDAYSHDALKVTSGNKYSGLVDISDTTAFTAVGTAISTPLWNAAYASADGVGLIGGSNTHGLILKAEEILNGGDPDAEKQIVMISDMMAYSYDGTVTYDGQDYNVPCTKDFGTGDYLEQYDLTWNTDKSDDAHTNPKFTDWAEMKSALENSSIREQMGWSRDALVTHADKNEFNLIPGMTEEIYKKMIAANGAWNGAAASSSHSVTGSEKSQILNYEALLDAMDNQKCHVSLVSNMEAKFGTNTGSIGRTCRYLDEMFSELKGSHPAMFKYFTVANPLSESDGKTVMDEIEDNILYLVKKGVATDTIGNKFDLCDTNGDAVTGNDLSSVPFTLSVGGVKADGSWDATSESLNFGTPENNVYPYVIRYDASARAFTWNINVPIEKAKQLVLSYHVKLNDRQTAAGTYTNVTNESAILNYWSYKEDTTLPAAHTYTFEKPSLSYIVSPKATSSDVTVSVVWVDSNNRHMARPSSVEVALKKNGTVCDTQVLSEANSWHYSWDVNNFIALSENINIIATEADASELPDGMVTVLATESDASEYVWTVDEVSVPAGYSKTVAENPQHTFLITNTYSRGGSSSGGNGNGGGTSTTRILNPTVPAAAQPDTSAAEPDTEITGNPLPLGGMPKTGDPADSARQLLFLTGMIGMMVALMALYMKRRRQ